ncbi:MAG: GGDEF domain-containing protein [Oceanospirillaceae bacterium]|nr:GGDEF domain-containing protein [Oceanospirillaceae bacterium]
MSQAFNATPENRALVSASPDILFVVKHAKIEPVSVGENAWLDSSKLNDLTLDELFDEARVEAIREAIESAERSDTKRAKMELLIGPDSPEIWGYLGLTKAQIFELTLVPLEEQRCLFAMRNTTELSRLQQAHLRDVMRDPLTGLRSHRALITVLEKSFGEAQRFDNMRFALVIADIDNFSDINDQYGWDAGDQVLKRFAEKIALTQRSSDFICRFGDDIFAMLLSEADIGDAVGMGHRLQTIAAELEFEFAKEPLNITLSIGTSAYIPEETETVHQLIHQAQDNLLIAQTHGGNEIISPV